MEDASNRRRWLARFPKDAARPFIAVNAALIERQVKPELERAKNTYQVNAPMQVQTNIGG